jgi:adenylate kinase family enzyme
MLNTYDSSRRINDKPIDYVIKIRIDKQEALERATGRRGPSKPSGHGMGWAVG